MPNNIKIKNIPVFYHIPKSAGTYVSDWFVLAFRHYRRIYTDWTKTSSKTKSSIKCVRVTSDGLVVAKLLIGDPEYFCDSIEVFHKKPSNTEWDIDIKYIEVILNSTVLFAIIISPEGFSSADFILNLIKGVNFYKFIILRDPFTRAQSLYNYITSEASSHERTHGRIKSRTFEDYILSKEIDDNWIIRNLNGTDISVPINEDIYKKTLDFLDTFSVSDIKDTNKALGQIFLKCYYFDIDNINLQSYGAIFNENKTVNFKIKFEDLSSESQEIFKKRTCWDQKLYQDMIIRIKENEAPIIT